MTDPNARHDDCGGDQADELAVLSVLLDAKNRSPPSRAAARPRAA